MEEEAEPKSEPRAQTLRSMPSPAQRCQVLRGAQTFEGLLFKQGDGCPLLTIFQSKAKHRLGFTPCFRDGDSRLLNHRGVPSATSTHVGDPEPSRAWVLSGTQVLHPNCAALPSHCCQEPAGVLHLHRSPGSPAGPQTPDPPFTRPQEAPPHSSFTTSLAFLTQAPSSPLPGMLRDSLPSAPPHLHNSLCPSP